MCISCELFEFILLMRSLVSDLSPLVDLMAWSLPRSQGKDKGMEVRLDRKLHTK